jgi:hypothetical protein
MMGGKKGVQDKKPKGNGKKSPSKKRSDNKLGKKVSSRNLPDREKSKSKSVNTSKSRLIDSASSATNNEAYGGGGGGRGGKSGTSTNRTFSKGSKR